MKFFKNSQQIFNSISRYLPHLNEYLNCLFIKVLDFPLILRALIILVGSFNSFSLVQLLINLQFSRYIIESAYNTLYFIYISLLFIAYSFTHLIFYLLLL